MCSDCKWFSFRSVGANGVLGGTVFVLQDCLAPWFLAFLFCTSPPTSKFQYALIVTTKNAHPFSFLNVPRGDAMVQGGNCSECGQLELEAWRGGKAKGQLSRTHRTGTGFGNDQRNDQRHSHLIEGFLSLSAPACLLPEWCRHARRTDWPAKWFLVSSVGPGSTPGSLLQFLSSICCVGPRALQSQVWRCWSGACLPVEQGRASVLLNRATRLGWGQITQHLNFSLCHFCACES